MTEYRGCLIEPKSSEIPIYFGVGLEGCDNEGYTQKYVKVTFPDKTWVLCANLTEAQKYIDTYLS